MCSPSTIVAVFLLLLLLVLLCCRAWFLPMGSSERTTNTRNNGMYMCIYIYIYIELVSPTGLPVKQTTFYETRSTQWFHPSRNIMLVVFCFLFVPMLFPQFGIASILFCCCCVSIPVFHLFVLNMASPNGFARRVYAYLSCVHAVVIQYVLFNSIYIRIDLI